METEAECYAQAAEYEQQATDAASDWAREVLLEVARCLASSGCRLDRAT